MWPISPELRWEPGRSHRGTSRVEVWSHGELIENDAQIVDGAVTEKWITGSRNSLSLSVPPTTEWETWLALPAVELKVFSGMSWGRSEYLCPMGVFPIFPGSRSLPAKAISINADDRWTWIKEAAMLYDWQGPAGWASVLAERLIREAGFSDVSTFVTRDVISSELMWDKARHDLIVDYLAPIGADAFVDREGLATIRTRGTQPGLDLSDGEGGTVVSISSTEDWSGVVNVVSVTSTKSGVNIEPAIVAITDVSHPAHRSNLGREIRVHLTSNLVENYGDGFNMATDELGRRAAPALSWQIECVPDATRMPGDLLNVSTDLGVIRGAVQEVTHPLMGGNQRIILGAV